MIEKVIVFKRGKQYKSPARETIEIGLGFAITNQKFMSSQTKQRHHQCEGRYVSRSACPHPNAGYSSRPYRHQV